MSCRDLRFPRRDVDLRIVKFSDKIKRRMAARGWTEAALKVIHLATAAGVAVEGMEIWLPTKPGPTIPTPFIYTWSMKPKIDGQGWDEYVRECNEQAKSYVQTFQWDERDKSHRS